MHYNWIYNSFLQRLAACLICCCLFSIELEAQLFINEAMPSNNSTIADENGEYDDWIELYNSGNSTVNLNGWSLSDDAANLNKTTLSGLTIPAGGFLLLWADDEVQEGNKHLAFKISGNETLYLTAPNAQNASATLSIPTGMAGDESYGSSTDGSNALQVFSDSTPEASNSSSSDVNISFSRDAGYFTGSFSLILSAPVSNGVIRYTTDGSDPVNTSTAYSSPVNISSNTILKAAFFFNNGNVSEIKTQRYVKMTTGMAGASSDLPIILIDTYSQTLNTSAKQNCFWSLIEPNNNGRAYGGDTPSYSGKTAMKIRGASSAGFAKKQWSIELRNEDDSDRKVPLLGMPENADWVLYAPGRYDRGLINNALMYALSNKLGMYASRTHFVEVYFNQDGGDLSDADYQGIYILIERIKVGDDRVDIAKLKPTDVNGDDLTGGYLFAIDRYADFTTPYTQAYYGSSFVGYVWVDPDVDQLNTTQINYISNEAFKFDNALSSPNWLDPVTGYKAFTDYKAWPGHHILKALTKEPDAFRLSFYLKKDKNDLIVPGPTWDYDRAINSTDLRSSDPIGWGSNNPSNVNDMNFNYFWRNPNNVGRQALYIAELVEDPDYRTAFYDQWYNWRKDDMLETSQLNALIDSLAAELTESVVRENARWGAIDNNYAPRYGGYWGEIDAMKQWLEDRSVWIDNALIKPPGYSPGGGNVNAGQQISLINTMVAGNIYYTLDGSDPMLEGGAVASNALLYSGSFPITNNGATIVNARIQMPSGEWGAYCKQQFYVNHNYAGLEINEIHYHPTDSVVAGDNVDGSKYEFIEIKNNGNSTVNLAGVKFLKGVEFCNEALFNLAPGGFYIIAADADRFMERYGFAPDATFTGKLDNGGETLLLADPLGNTIDQLTYDDVNPWDAGADGSGNSLALIPISTNNALASNWKTQVVWATPKAENDFCIPILLNFNVSNISCNGAANGSIVNLVSGGNAPLSYNWSNGPTSVNQNNLGPGNYTLTITDQYGCDKTQSYQVTQPSALSISGNSTDVDCNGNNTGSINLNVSGGTAAYTYSWNNGATSANLNNVPAGLYQLQVVDANGCTENKSFNIQEPSLLTVNGNSTNVDCNGNNTGSINLNVSGGVATYTFDWSNGANTANLNNIGAGNYSVQVTDANGCVENKSFNVSQPTVLTVNGTTNSVDCNGANTGAVNLIVNGGTPGYNYAWNNGSNAGNLSNVSAGSYAVTVTDDNGCSKNEIFNVTEPSLLNVSGNTTDVSCNGAGDGLIILSVSGGTSGYNFAWSNGSSSPNLAGISGGNYSVTVTDNNGCTENASFSITELAAIQVTSDVTNIDCNGEDTGEIDLTVNGGAGGYTYSWSDGSTGSGITNLTAGVYDVTISDADGCLSNKSYLVNQSLALSSSTIVNDVTCNNGSNGSISLSVSGGVGPYTYLWSDGSTNSQILNTTWGNYTVDITDALGCTITESYTINQPNAIVTSPTINDVSCFGGMDGGITTSSVGGAGAYTYSWNNGSTTSWINNVSAGNYTLTITDVLGCTKSSTFLISEANPISINTTTTDLECNGDNDALIISSVNGGTNPYNYNWSNGANSSSLNGVGAGSYTLEITDINGCTGSETVIINEPAAISIAANIQDESIAGYGDGEIDINVNGGNGPYTYFWTNGVSTEDNFSLSPGIYTVFVTDANNCAASASFTVQTGGNACNTPSGVNILNVQETSVSIDWNADPNVQNYTVEYRETGNANWISFNTTFNFSILSDLNPCSDYEFRIAANCSNGFAVLYSNISTFITSGCALSCPGIVGLFSQNVTGQSSILVWDLVPNASYNLNYRVANTGSWQIYTSSFPIGILFGLTPCTDYEWFVEVICPDGTVSIASPTHYFSTSGGNCRQEISHVPEIEMELYPIPADDYLELRTSIDEDLTVELYNLQGQLLFSDQINSYKILNTSHLSAGIYVLKVGSETRQIVIE